MVSYPAEKQWYGGAPVGLRSRWRVWRLSSGFDGGALLLIAVVAATALLTVGDCGISNDEGVQHRYGELIIAY